MKTNIKMPEVRNCAQTACAYNKGSGCHARAITVGGGKQEHVCDTMVVSEDHTLREDTAGVGACRAVDCVFNEDWECVSDGINVSAAGGQAECLTYKAPA